MILASVFCHNTWTLHKTTTDRQHITGTAELCNAVQRSANDQDNILFYQYHSDTDDNAKTCRETAVVFTRLQLDLFAADCCVVVTIVSMSSRCLLLSALHLDMLDKCVRRTQSLLTIILADWRPLNALIVLGETSRVVSGTSVVAFPFICHSTWYSPRCHHLEDAAV